MYKHPARGQPGCRFDCSRHGRPPIIPGFELEIAESLVAISELVWARENSEDEAQTLLLHSLFLHAELVQDAEGHVDHFLVHGTGLSDGIGQGHGNNLVSA